MIWFTSDTHFGHANIIKYAGRPFSSVEEMDAALIRNWNERVAPDDVVYHLGDFSFGHSEHYYEQLNGTVHILLGSHDSGLSLTIPDRRLLTVIHTIALDETWHPLVDDHRQRIVLCHHPMRSWPLSHYGSWHLFGHHHGKLDPYGLSFDVGVDAWDYYPVSLTQVMIKMATLEPIVDYSKNHKP